MNYYIVSINDQIIWVNIIIILKVGEIFKNQLTLDETQICKTKIYKKLNIIMNKKIHYFEIIMIIINNYDNYK